MGNQRVANMPAVECPTSPIQIIAQLGECQDFNAYTELNQSPKPQLNEITDRKTAARELFDALIAAEIAFEAEEEAARIKAEEEAAAKIKAEEEAAAKIKAE